MITLRVGQSAKTFESVPAMLEWRRQFAPSGTVVPAFQLENVFDLAFKKWVYKKTAQSAARV